jgi:succinyl-CoA synthetase beta subunit
MNFREYQPIQLIAQNAIPAPCGRVADSAKGLVAAVEGFGEGS